MRRAVPIGLHCGGVVTTGSGKVWKRMVEAMSWSSLLCQRGTSYFRNYLICMLVKMLMVAKDDVNTMNDFFRELCWSLYWLYMGVHPDRDSRNRLYTSEDGILFERKFDPLAGGYFGATWTFAWDLEWMRDYIRLSGLADCVVCVAATLQTFHGLLAQTFPPGSIRFGLTRLIRLLFPTAIVCSATCRESPFFVISPTGYIRNILGAMHISLVPF